VSFYIKTCPSLIMRIIECKNRVQDKIMSGVELNKQGRIDADLQGLMDNIEDLEITWKDQMMD